MNDAYADVTCRLCSGSKCFLFHTDKNRSYLKCETCKAAFVPDSFILSPSDEKAVYDLHENSLKDDGYKRFLSRATDPLTKFFSTCENISRKIHGLDFGCGPAPLLASMLRDAPHNYHVVIYDKFYFPDETMITNKNEVYDFVTATEVMEHLLEPLCVIEHLWSTIKVGGVFLIMTKRLEGSIEKFRNWHYIRDPTHIMFFSNDTFMWLGKHLSSNQRASCEIVFESADVAMLIKRQH